MPSINLCVSNFLIQLNILIIAICSCKDRLCKYKSKTDIFVLSTLSLVNHTKQLIKLTNQKETYCYPSSSPSLLDHSVQSTEALFPHFVLNQQQKQLCHNIYPPQLIVLIVAQEQARRASIKHVLNLTRNHLMQLLYFQKPKDK